MQPIHSENVSWKARKRGVREAQIYSAIHGSDETRIDMIEVPAGGYIPPHRHSSRTEFITILASAGAQLQIGERIFRPIAGQVFQREPGDVLALTNDSQHPFCYSVVRFRFESSDVEYLNSPEGDEDEAVEVAPAPGEAEKAEVETKTEVEEVEEAEVEAEVDESESEESEDAEEEAEEAEASAEETDEAEVAEEAKEEPKKEKKSKKKSKDDKDSKKSSKKKSSKSSKKKK